MFQPLVWVWIIIITILLHSQSIIIGCHGGIVPELHLDIASPLSSSSSGFAVATLEPTIKVTTQGSLLNDWCDYSGGVTIRATTADGTTPQGLPWNVWGILQKKDFLGWDWKARLDTASSHWNEVMEVDVQAVGGPTDLLVRASGFLSSSGSSGSGSSPSTATTIKETILATRLQVQNVALTQGFRLPKWMGGRTLSVSPAYNVLSQRTKVGVTYDASSRTQIMVDANPDQQTMTIAHAINDANTIVPSISSNGNIAIDYHYAVLDSGGLLSTKYRPNDATTTLEYRNGPWIASATLPMEGYYKLLPTKPKFLLRRALTVE